MALITQPPQTITTTTRIPKPPRRKFFSYFFLFLSFSGTAPYSSIPSQFSRIKSSFSSSFLKNIQEHWRTFKVSWWRVEVFLFYSPRLRVSSLLSPLRVSLNRHQRSLLLVLLFVSTVRFLDLSTFAIIDSWISTFLELKLIKVLIEELNVDHGLGWEILNWCDHHEIWNWMK